MEDFTASHVVFAAAACPGLTMVLGRYAPRDATLAVTEEKCMEELQGTFTYSKEFNCSILFL